jgi:hypothetical protein
VAYLLADADIQHITEARSKGIKNCEFILQIDYVSLGLFSALMKGRADNRRKLPEAFAASQLVVAAQNISSSPSSSHSVKPISRARCSFMAK